MATRQYIGARYVPIIANPAEWSSANTYEPLTIVTYQGNSYTSRQFVPANIDINNTSYWVETGNYNAQIEQYRQDVNRYRAQIEEEWPEWKSDTETDLNNWKSDTETDLNNWKSDTETDLNNWKSDTETDLNNWKSDTIDPIENQLDEITPVVPDDPRTGTLTPSWFLNENDLTGKIGAKIVAKDSSGNYKAYMAPNIYNANINYSNLDVCHAITIANTYIQQMRNFYYGNDHISLAYEGTYNNPVPARPTEHKNENDQMPIDCNGLTQLIGHGVLYDNSTYNNPNLTENYALHKMFDLTGEAIKPYWYYGINHPHPQADTGYGRLLTDGFAKMLYDCGRLQIITPGQPAFCPLGAIVFVGNPDNPNGRFMGITHCYMIVGWIGGGSNNKIVVEAIDDDDRAGIGVHLITSRLMGHSVAYYVPPYMNNEYLQNIIGNYMLSERNVRLSNIHWEPQNFYRGARVVTITPQSSLTAYSYEVTLSPKTEYENLPLEEISDTFTNKKGVRRIIFPYGYDISITSESESLFNINYQCITSDKFLSTPTNI